MNALVQQRSGEHGTDASVSVVLVGLSVGLVVGVG